MSLGRSAETSRQSARGAAWLARGVAASFFVSDVEHHWQALLDYAQPELQGDEWQDADAEDQVDVGIA